MSKHVVVLGGGYAGVLVAKKLAKKTKKTNDVNITLIDKNPFHTMLTELHEVAAWRVEEESIRIDLKKIFAGRNVNVVLDHITKADYANNTLVGKKTDYKYDYLVMASGCKPTFFGVEGAEENAFSLWSYEDSVKLREHIANMFRLAAVELDEEKKRTYLKFYVIGGGFTGVEMAGELAEAVPQFCEKFSVDSSLVEIYLLDFLDKIMPILPDKDSTKAKAILEKAGVAVMLGKSVTAIGKDAITFKDKDGNSTTEATNTVMWCAGTESSDIAMASSELGHVDRTRGRIQVDHHLRTIPYPNVYVAGDNMYYIPEGEKESVPQMVENCEHCAPVIATNIAEELQGRSPVKIYKPTFHGVMVCIGGRKGVANVGLPGRMFSLPSFFAMLSKHFINMVYFVQILGFHKVFSYMSRQFFTIRNRRSFVGGHLSNRAPLFLMMPLRVFTGIYLIYRGYARWATGWVATERLEAMYFTLANTFRPSLVDISFFDQIRFSIYMANNTLHLWLQTTPMGWFLETFVVATPSQEMFWQWAIMLFEFAAGAALIAGLLTTLVSFSVTAVMVLVILTVGLPMYMWWLPFAGIGFMFTGSKALALDYYFMPWLKKRWKNIPFVKKWYLYT